MGRRTISERQALALDVGVVMLSLYGVYRELAFPADARRLIDLPVGVYVIAQIGGALTLVWRRSRTVPIGWVNAALNLISPTQSSYFAAYALGAHTDRRRWAAATFAALLAAFALGAQLWNLEDPVTGPAILCLAGLAGMYVRARRTLYDALEERAERAEREQVQLARAAVADERVRIANDMHDAVAHQVTLMVLQAGALSVAGPDDATRRTAEDLRARGVDALVELRDIIGVMRDDPIDPTSGTHAEPARRVDTEPTLKELVAVAAASGVDVHLNEHDGTSRTAQDAALVRRIVREGLTNVVKHAPGSTVHVDVSVTDADTVVHVVNTAPTSGPDHRLGDSGAGSGLHDLRRRITEHGGRLDHDRRPDGGFELTAHIAPSDSRGDGDATTLRLAGTREAR